MSRRARAVSFAAAAALCAGLAASAIGGEGSGIESQLGPLRPALVAREPLPEGRTLSTRTLARSVEVRRVPARFLPPGTLSGPELAAGRRTLTAVPAGGYLLSSALRAPGSAREGSSPGPRPAAGRAVEIAVTGAAALSASGRSGRRVDVVVTSEPGPGGGGGSTYVAAEAVPLLELRSPTEADPGGLPSAPGSWLATLSVSRKQALRLIQAESFARSVRLIASN